MKIAAIIVAAGRGLRAGGDIPKQWQSLCDKRVIDWTIDAFRSHPSIGQIVVVLHRDDFAQLTDTTLILTQGGATRAASVRAGLTALANSAPDAVLIHDAARACVTRDVIDRVIAALQNGPAAAPGIAVVDALWTTQDDHVIGTTPRDGLMRAQTPQGFHYPSICKAHDTIQDTQAADDVDIARRAGLTVRVVAGSEDNIKITTPQDFTRAAHILRTRQ